MTASMGMETAIRRRLTRRRWRTFHPLLNSLVQGKGGRRDTSPVKRASPRLPRFFFFSFFLCSSPAAFLLSPRSCCYRKKAAMSSKGAIDFDRLPHPPSKRLRPYGGIRERRNNKTHVLQRKTVNSIADISSLREAEEETEGSLIFSVLSALRSVI